MDYCDEQLVDSFWASANNDTLDEALLDQVKRLFKTYSPLSLLLCAVSLIINFQIVTSKRAKSNSLLVNLMVTNAINSLITGGGILLIKFLPVNYEVIAGDCFLLVLEILQIASLFASCLHHLLLSFRQLADVMRRRTKLTDG